MSLFLCFF
jgi:hypothetical protein